MSSEVTENILYMKLLHELKAAFPALSDDVVRQCMAQFGKDKNRCIEFLSHETDRKKHGPYGRYNQQRKFSIQALLNHQVEQCLKLEHELSKVRQEAQAVQDDVVKLEKKLNISQLVSQGKISAETIEQEISELRQACDSMTTEVTKLTKGSVPLGETSIQFYESLPTALEHEASCSRSRHNPGRRRSNPNLSDSSGLVEEKQWPCSACTFLNHPALKNCEECDMPRIALGTTTADSRQLANTTSNERKLAKQCFCHTRLVTDIILPATKSRRLNRDHKSFDDLSPVRELSPSSTLTNSSNVEPPFSDEADIE